MMAERGPGGGGGPEGAPGDPEKEALENALAEANRRADEYWQQFLRARADLENYQKRVQRDLEASVRRQKAGLLLRLLEVMDNFDRALAAAENRPEAAGADGEAPARAAPAEGLIEGFRLIHRLLQQALAAEGVEPFSAVGQPFDPAWHEAISVWESDAVTEATVTDEIQRGYVYHGEVLRAARVRVARPRATEH